jgi:hypothetical protein
MTLEKTKNKKQKLEYFCILHTFIIYITATP